MTQQNLRSELGAEVPSLSFQFALFVLLVGEVAFLTFRYDASGLERQPFFWATVVGAAPQLLRLSTTALAAVLLFSGQQLWDVLRSTDLFQPTSHRLRLVVGHLATLILFTWTTAQLMDGDSTPATAPAFWAALWFILGTVTLLFWSLALLPYPTWKTLEKRGRFGILCGVVVGTLVWASGFLTQKLWNQLAIYTFNVVSWILRWLYVDVISDATKLNVGTRAFLVNIAPECSGYEGVGLIVAFMGAYLWLSRDRLRFPAALMLLPVSAVVIWILNAVRIAGLVIIGNAGWPDVALGGFHSQAGWLTFNGVALGLVAITVRGQYFATADQREILPDSGPNPTSAYLVPYLAVLAVSMITGAVSAGVDWFYPFRILAGVGALWTFRKEYGSGLGLNWRCSWPGISTGVCGAIIWIVLATTRTTSSLQWPAATSWESIVWWVFRAGGYVVVVPIVEELAFRGYLTRRLIQADFRQLPMGTFSWLSFVVSSVLFGVLHQQNWLAGTVVGMLFAVALYYRRSLGDAIQAHITTNGLIVLYVLFTGRWSVWS